MGQVYLEDYEGPLYAFVEFKVDDLLVTFSNGYASFEGGEKYSLDHITDFEHGDTYISNVVMSFSITKESSVNRGGKSWGIGQEFNITVFDDTAVYIEEIIANALGNSGNGANCYIEYGWASNGKKIEERCNSFEGLLLEYTLNFEGSSTSINIAGTTQQVFTLGTSYVTNDSGNTMGNLVNLDVGGTYGTSTGNPGLIVEGIVENILNNDGSGITYVADIEPTVVVYTDAERTLERNLACHDKTLGVYLKELCSWAKSEDGRTGYVFYFENDPDDESIVHVVFKPQNSFDNSVEVYDEEGRLTEAYKAFTESTSEIERTYNYYGGFQKGEVLSYSSEFKGFAVSGGSRRTSAVDPNTNELIACEVEASDSDNFISPKSACRVMGLSSGTYDVLDLAMRDLWNKYASQVYSASLEIMGDPNINVMDVITLNVYTKYNQLHHTSGEYIVQVLEDSVDNTGFTTSITMMRKGAIKDFSTYEVQREEDVGTGGKNLTEEGYPSSTSGMEKSYSTEGSLIDRGFSSYIISDDGTIITSGGANKQTGNIVSVSGIGKKSQGYTDTAGTSKGDSDVANPVVYDK